MRWTPDAKGIVYVDRDKGLLLQALDEDPPQVVKEFETIPIRSFVWSFDGKKLAYASGASTNEIILIENFKK
jgi:hypothetical protein